MLHIVYMLFSVEKKTKWKCMYLLCISSICVCFSEFVCFHVSVYMFMNLCYIFRCFYVSIICVRPEKVTEYSSTIKSKESGNFILYMPDGAYDFAQTFLSSIVSIKRLFLL
jgi:hypothetical protein